MQQATAPVLFNAIKHHLGWVQLQIRMHSPSATPQILRRLLLPIGAAQFDFYTGSLSIDPLVSEVKAYLLQNGVSTQELYKRWIDEKLGHRLVTLSDTSVWVLRLGKQPDFWVHLHPARYAPHTMRLKAATLKTAIALAVFYPQELPVNPPALSSVNEIRSFLQLPPLAAKHLHEGLWQTVKLIAH